MLATKPKVVKIFAWIPNEVEGYVLQEVDPTTNSVMVKDKKGQMIPYTGVQHSTNPADMDKSPDTTMLVNLNEAAVLQNLRVRYSINQIYTYTGYILIAVNPYQRLPLYSDEILLSYRGKAIGRMPPHVYAIADRAYRSMKAEQKSQSVLISGESGAGKTETAKIVMQYIVKVGGRQDDLAQRIIDSNPILEAFGNAKTLRNNNSSRFGKFMEIHFNPKAEVIGAKIETYLLEKSRIVYQNKGERNYHIFYNLCACKDPMRRAKLQLNKAEEFYYLSQSGCTTVNGVDDQHEFDIVSKALADIGMSAKDIEEVFTLVSGVLHLGNMKYDVAKNDSVSIKTTDELRATAKLFGLDSTLLDKRLTTKLVKAGGKDATIIEVPLKSKDASYSRDALAKAIYGRIFDYIVSRVSNSLQIKEQSSAFVGILDIFGFEYFEHNSFEQFCINFANEKLQQHFNEHLFISEKDIYRLEGVKAPPIEYTDNQDCIDLIEQRPSGIIAILDEQCQLPNATDKKFAIRVHAAHGNHVKLLAPKMSKSNQLTTEDAFIIKHYAAEVCYEVQGFLDKNNDKLDLDLAAMLKDSKIDLLRQLFEQAIDDKKAKFGTVGNMFSRNLTDLVENLNTTVCHFIRCIKPNMAQVKSVFEGGNILNQLRCNGMLDVLKLMHAGYPTRCPYDDLYQRFKPVLPPILSNLDPPHFCEALLMALDCNRSDFALGLTKLFFKSGKLAFLEEIRSSGAELPKDIVQKVMKWIARKRFRRAIWSVVAFHKLSRRLEQMRAMVKIHIAAKQMHLIAVTWVRVAQKVRLTRLIVTGQSYIRMWLKRSKWLKLRKGALMAQKMWRGVKTRREFKPKLAAHKIERAKMMADKAFQEEQRKKAQAEAEKEKQMREKKRKEREEQLRLEQEKIAREAEEEERKLAENKREKEAKARREQEELEEKRRQALEIAQADETRKAKRELERQMHQRDEYIRSLEEQVRNGGGGGSGGGGGGGGVAGDAEYEAMKEKLKQEVYKNELLTDEVDELKLQIAKLTTRLEDALKSRDGWRKQCEDNEEKSTKESKDRLSELTKLKMKVNSLEEGEKHKERMRGQLEQQLNDEIDELRDELDETLDVKDKVEEKCTSLEEEIKKLKQAADDEKRKNDLEAVKLQQQVNKMTKSTNDLKKKILLLEQGREEDAALKADFVQKLMTSTETEQKEKEQLRQQILKLGEVVKSMEASGINNRQLLEISAQLDAGMSKLDQQTAQHTARVAEISSTIQTQATEDSEFEKDLLDQFRNQSNNQFQSREQLRKDILSKLTQENRELTEKSSGLLDRVRSLEEELEHVKAAAVADGSAMSTEKKVIVLENEKNSLYKIKDVLNERVQTLEQEREEDKTIKKELVTKMKEAEAREQADRSTVESHLKSLEEKTKELERQRDDRMKQQLEILKQSGADLAARDKEIKRLAQEKVMLNERLAKTEATANKSASSSDALTHMQYESKQRRDILDLWSDLNQCTLERLNRLHNDLVGFSELVYYSNTKIDQVIQDAKKRNTNADMTPENMELLALLLEQARLRKTLNDYSEEILRQTLEKIEDPPTAEASGVSMPAQPQLNGRSNSTMNGNKQQQPPQQVQQQGSGFFGGRGFMKRN